MSNIAVLTRERWINPESCTPEREITLADLKEKQCRWNTLYVPAIYLLMPGFALIVLLWEAQFPSNSEGTMHFPKQHYERLVHHMINPWMFIG